MIESTFGIIDFCAGIGGFSKPFEKREVNGEIWGNLPGEWAWVTDMGADARAVCASNFAASGLDVNSDQAKINSLCHRVPIHLLNKSGCCP